MSNAKQETIEDIVGDIRAQNQGLPEDSYALSPLVCDLLSLADRIKAAHQREVAELKSKMNDVVCENEAMRDACGTCGAKREVAELRECLKETMVIAIAEYHYNSCFKHVKCGEIERCKTCKVIRWRKALQDEGGEK